MHRVEGIAKMVIKARSAAGKAARGEEVPEEVLERVSSDISTEEFRAYVAASQQYRPVPNDDVEKAMVEWFRDLKVDLPSRYRDAINAAEKTGDDYEGPPLPVTVRKLNAMQRLTEASARMRHDDEVTMEDFERVKPFIERSLADIGIAPTDNAAFGSVDDTISSTSLGLSD